ncbi:hypothetical protein ON010_g13416 [Phytophthora cinnamomi]|nr:hypothetical protein ON010_g13416 [Phytophthora cinnamomi]
MGNITIRAATPVQLQFCGVRHMKLKCGDLPQDADGDPPDVRHLAHPRLLHAQGQVHAADVPGEAEPDHRRLPAPGRPAPVLRRPHQHPVRPRPLQAGARPGQHGARAHRQHRQGLRAHDQVRRLALPLQAAQARRARPHVHAAQEAEGLARVPRGGAQAPVAPPVHRPQHAHAAGHRLPQRGQVELHEQGHARRRGRAALRLHHQGAVRGPPGLQVPALAGHRYARYSGPRAGGPQHHRDAGRDGAGPLAGVDPVLHGHLRAVRLHHRAAAESVREHPPAVRQQAARARVQQD